MITAQQVATSQVINCDILQEQCAKSSQKETNTKWLSHLYGTTKKTKFKSVAVLYKNTYFLPFTNGRHEPQQIGFTEKINVYLKVTKSK